MKAVYWRQGVAAILTAGLLAVGAVAQDGAEGEVNITESAPAEAAEAEEPAVEAKPAKPQIVDRDPFVNQLLTGNVVSRVATSRTRRSVQAADSGGDDEGLDDGELGEDGEEEAEEIPAPEVTVNGIVSSGSGRQAIISTGNGTKMISRGQKLGDYRVSSISKTAVTFAIGEQTFKVPLESEFGE